MSDVFSATGSVSTVTDAYNKLADFQFRPELVFAQSVTKKKPTALSHRGDVVTFPIYDELAAATSELNESVDVDAVEIGDSTVTVTLKEYGNAALYTLKLVGTSYLEVDQDIANLIGWNMGDSYDSLVRAAVVAGANAIYGGGKAARNTVTPADTFTASLVRQTTATLRTNNVPTINGTYQGFIHPHQSVDFRTETADLTSWRAPHVYHAMNDGAIRTASIGTFEGVDFMETPRVPILADAGSSTTLTDVYQSVILGRDAICMAYSAKASAETPRIVIGPQTDKLKRFFPIGWYWLGGFDQYKEVALRRIETASSLGANA